MRSNSTIPFSWQYTDLENIADINPKFDKIKNSDELEVSFIPMKRVSELTGIIDLSEIRKLGEVKKGYTPFQSGDIIFAKITPCMENGKVAILSGLLNDIGFGSTEFHVLRLPDYMPRKYLFYYLIQESFRRDAERNMTGSVGQKRVPADFLKKTSIPLPPLEEQQRIVAKIEELFTKLDAGVEALRQVQVQLKRYRQSVLKAAVEGRLTAEWRKQNKDGLEPANQLMKRIQEERKAKLGKKYKEPISVDTLDMPELPEGWVVSSVGSLYDIVGGGTPSTKVSEYWDGDNPWITSADISGQGKISPRKSITQEGIENSATNLVPKNSLVVVTRVGLGKVALTDFPLCFSQDSQALIGSKNYINPKFAFYYLLRTVQIFKYRSRGTTISGVTKKQLFELPFSIPPYQEQQEIITRIESIYSAIDACDLIIKSELKRAQSLQQSILKRAFEGKLVPQDPNDEPASVLLERIKAEKAKLKKSKQMEMF